VTFARKRRLAAHIFTVAALVAWAAYSASVPSYQVPGPVAVARSATVFVTDRFAFAHLAYSLAHVASAIIGAFVLGSALALLAHYAPVFRLLVHGRIAPFLNSFSGIGWTLLAVLWFGVNDVTVVFAITAVLLPFSIVNMREGLDSLDPELLEMGQSFGRSRWRNFRKVVLPALAPFIFASLRVSFGVAWKVTLTAELFGGSAGLGYLVNVAREEFDTPLIFAAIGLIVLFVHLTDRHFLTPIQAHVVRRYRAA
jgi:NitT/TauT family transport system permease protein/sulfonate transport system permease protein